MSRSLDSLTALRLVGTETETKSSSLCMKMPNECYGTISSVDFIPSYLYAPHRHFLGKVEAEYHCDGVRC